MTMEVRDPGNEAAIDLVYVFLSVDADGNHGILGGMVPGLGATPFVTASRKVAEDLMKPLAESMARATGKRVAMHVFVRRERVWEFDPRN